MAIRPICITGNPVLHTRAAEVVDFDAELNQLVQDMFETMDAAPGVGLAAPQVGVGKRIFTYNYTEDDGTHKRGVVINPVLEIGPVSEEMPDDEEESEGCLTNQRLRQSSTPKSGVKTASLGCPVLTT